MLQEEEARQHTWGGERKVLYLTMLPVANATQRRSVMYEQWLNDTDRRKADILQGGKKNCPSAILSTITTTIHSFSSLSYDRSKASSKASSPHSAI
jgi:hypothetical protein